MEKKRGYRVVVVVFDEEEVLYLANLKSLASSKQTEIEQVASPNTNLLALTELMRTLANENEHMYYMNEVRTISRQAREEITKRLKDELPPSASPF